MSEISLVVFEGWRRENLIRFCQDCYTKIKEQDREIQAQRKELEAYRKAVENNARKAN